MKNKKIKMGLLLFFLFLVLTTFVIFYLYTYRGTFLGEEFSPNRKYSLRYYSSFDPFQPYWTMPGDSTCDPIWVRLYDNEGNKLNEKYTTSCDLEGRAYWLDNKVILRDVDTLWVLPSDAER